jgi:tetratricopeptide (TPR) repeat protein
MRVTFVAGLVFAGVLLAADSPESAARQASLTVKEAVAAYTGRDFARAVSDLNTQRLTVTSFTTELDSWIAAGDPATASRRKIVAAAFALDAVWVATRNLNNALRANGDPWKRVTPNHPDKVVITSFVSQPLIARWATTHLPPSGMPDALERTLWLTAVGIVEDGHAWHQLRHEILPQALARFPGEPRFQLATVLATTNMDLGSLRQSSTSRNDVLRRERLPSAVTDRIPNAIRAFEPLLANQTLSGEVELRIGYLKLRREEWLSALTHLAAAHSLATEPALRVAADYFAGWVHEQLDQPAEAIANYRRAHDAAPLLRNLSTRLAALLFLNNERNEAYTILDRTVNAESSPLDPLLAVERADARFVPEWIASIRRSLQ